MARMLIEKNQTKPKQKQLLNCSHESGYFYLKCFHLTSSTNVLDIWAVRKDAESAYLFHKNKCNCC